MLVYDITNRDSFDTLHIWLDDVLQSCPDVELLLVGNKADLKQQRQVKMEEAIEFASRHGMSFVETSALDGSNTVKAIQLILQGIYIRYYLLLY